MHRMRLGLLLAVRMKDAAAALPLKIKNDGRRRQIYVLIDISCIEIARDKEKKLKLMKQWLGDSGKTHLYGGECVDKNNPVVVAYGTIDELNSFIGLAITRASDESIKQSLHDIQRDLFTIGADLATPAGKDAKRLPAERITEMEELVKHLEAELPQLHNFILPTGAPGAALLHIARSVCRRAERETVDIRHGSKTLIIKYLNRLSYILFLLARKENAASSIEEEIWKG